MPKSVIVRKPVKSSNVKSIGFDASTGTLSVEFSSGGVYHYEGVPAGTAEALQGAPSIGKFLNTHIKDKFKFTEHQ